MSTTIADPSTRPVAVVLDFAGLTSAEYDLMVSELRLTPAAGGPSGCLYHWVRTYPDGVRMIQVWRRLELFETFLDGEVRPLLRRLGLVEPRLGFHDVPFDS